MSWTPEFKLYASDGVTLVYTFPVVQATNAPQSPKKVVEHQGQRGKGSIIIDGGEAPWDLTIRGILTTEEDIGADAYKDLISKMDTLESSVALNTQYVLHIDKTESTYYSYNVKRIQPITYETGLRINAQEYEVILRANCW